MSASGIMGTSAAGMTAQSDRLNAVADNIANVATTGYKMESVEFSTMLPRSGGLQYESGSVEALARHHVDKQGAFTYSASPTDLAVKGNGFFVVSGPRGDVALTRAGAFVADASGDLMNAAGYKLLGYDIQKSGIQGAANGVGGLTGVNLKALALTARPSTSADMRVNLPADATAVAAGASPSQNTAASTYNAKSSLVGYDNLGHDVTFDIYFAKTANNEWEVTAYNRADAAAGTSFPYANAPLASATVSFDPTNGAIAASSAHDLSFAVPNGGVVKLDLTGSTQLATGYVVQSANIDGNAPAAVNRVEMSNDGVLTAVYDNGARIPTYKVPLGRVPSPDNLVPQAGNVFTTGTSSGAMVIGDASVGGAGSIISGALEASTVDLASELTIMIEAQRSYTANSRVFQTGSELMDVIVNLKR